MPSKKDIDIILKILKKLVNLLEGLEKLESRPNPATPKKEEMNTARYFIRALKEFLLITLAVEMRNC